MSDVAKKQHQRWECPACSRIFKVALGRDLPALCPDCMRDGQAKASEAPQTGIEAALRIEEAEVESFPLHRRKPVEQVNWLVVSLSLACGLLGLISILEGIALSLSPSPKVAPQVAPLSNKPSQKRETPLSVTKEDILGCFIGLDDMDPLQFNSSKTGDGAYWNAPYKAMLTIDENEYGEIVEVGIGTILDDALLSATNRELQRFDRVRIGFKQLALEVDRDVDLVQLERWSREVWKYPESRAEIYLRGLTFRSTVIAGKHVMVVYSICRSPSNEANASAARLRRARGD